MVCSFMEILLPTGEGRTHRLETAGAGQVLLQTIREEATDQRGAM